MDLTEKKCVPCEGGIPPLNRIEIDKYKKQINEDWKVEKGKKLVKNFSFINFRQTMDFVNKIASLAEEEGHHPDMYVSYANLKIELWTHSMNGLSENDFILAAKIDRLKI